MPKIILSVEYTDGREQNYIFAGSGEAIAKYEELSHCTNVRRILINSIYEG